MSNTPLLVAGLFVYLVLVSLVCAYTFPESDVEQFGESMFYEPFKVENLTVSSATNLSELNIQITRGRWILKDGALESDSKKENEFFIGLYDDGECINYSLENADRDFCVYFYRSTSLMGRSRAYRYCFDVEDSIVTFQEVNYYLWAIGGWHILASGTCLSLTSNSDVIINLTAIPGGTPEEGGVYSSVAVDDITLLYKNYPEHYDSSGLAAGVWTNGKKFRVSIDRDVKYTYPEESEVGFKIVPLMLKLIFFHAPELSLPLWLNLIMFKVPVLVGVLVVITVLRGI